jgi:hypothetical protein
LLPYLDTIIFSFQPYLHNGVIYVGDEDHYALPQFGK